MLFNKQFLKLICKVFTLNIELGKSVHQARNNSLILFPHRPNVFSCGISAFVAFKKEQTDTGFDLTGFSKEISKLSQHMALPTGTCEISIEKAYLGGDKTLAYLFKTAQTLKLESVFSELIFNNDKILELTHITGSLNTLIGDQETAFKGMGSAFNSADMEIVSLRIEKLKDIFWCLKKEILDNIIAIKNLTQGLLPETTPAAITIFKRINAVLNSIDRLEVRGRDSAGISAIFTLKKNEFESFRKGLIRSGLSDALKARTNHLVLSNNSITINDTIEEKNRDNLISISFVYKFAAEIGALGDNIAYIRSQIKNDHLLQLLTNYAIDANSVSAHTRWASVGDISEANCHPLDNTPTDTEIDKTGIIHVCLNGDIDNYLELKTEYEARYDKIHKEINTDTKLIPLQIEHHLKQGNTVEEAFRLAVNDFHGSHAISMHTDLAPGKLFLAQKGSGQAIFVGIAPDHYIAASELYGVVEETQDYIKLNGEERGQIVLLDQHSAGGIEGIRSFYYDNTPIALLASDVQTSQITSRDIDRQIGRASCRERV